MLHFLAPKPPLSVFEKTWTETRMLWLAERLGIERLLTAPVVLPNEEFFPDDYYGSPHDAERIMLRLCKLMHVDPGPLSFEVVPDKLMPGAADHYEFHRRRTIRIAESQLDDPLQLAATLAHELAHELLLGGGLTTVDQPDHESLTDLLPVYLGLGVLLANATLRENSGTMSQQGYLPARTIGYALALFAWVREKEQPSWEKFLRTDASAAMRGGLRFLRKTNDSLFRPDTIRGGPVARNPSELVERLRNGSPTLRMAALWELREPAAAPAEAVPAIVRLLSDGNHEIRQEAARTLGSLAELDPSPAAEFAPAGPKLFKFLRDRRACLRQTAAFALGRLRIDPRRAVEELTILLDDPSRDVVQEAALSLAEFGLAAEPATDSILEALRKALIDCDYPLIDCQLVALRAATPDAASRVKTYFEKRDAELLEQALELFAESK